MPFIYLDTGSALILRSKPQPQRTTYQPPAPALKRGMSVHAQVHAVTHTFDRAYELNPGASLVFYERREGLRSWAGGAFTQKGRFLEQWCWPNWDFYIAASIRGCSFNFTAARVHPWLLFFLTSRSFFLRRGHVFSPQCALFVRPPPDVPSARRTRAELPRGASRVSHSAPGLQVGPRKPCVR